jgi:aerobic-type carbon monoxide dehydrogenase small subunit (CoxS/CutS family)
MHSGTQALFDVAPIASSRLATNFWAAQRLYYLSEIPESGRSFLINRVFQRVAQVDLGARFGQRLPRTKGDQAMTEKASFKAIHLTTEEDVPKAVSRRNFIKGVITSGVAVSSASYLFRASSQMQGQQLAAGVGERLLTLNVNGQQRRVDVMKQETLAWTLRYKLGLTGTKLGCDRAECGSCSVLIDDIPYYSCSVLTHTVRGRKVTTIEGLASDDGTLHPVQQGVVDEQGFQCAFCMSGFIMTAVGYLKTNPNPTRLELAHGISGNLCRCQDYDKILTALMRGADNLRRSALG